MKPITVYLVRHGQTWFNRYNKMQGWSDSPLTPSGIDDAKLAGQKLKHITFTNAYASDTTRATNTAKMILAANFNSHTELNITPHFREQFYGYYEGEDSPKAWYAVGQPHGARTFSQIIEKFGVDASKNFMHEADPFHEAEDALTYWNRLQKGFKQLREENQNGDNVLLVSHGTTIRSIVDKFGKEDGFVVTESPKNGSISKIQLTDSGIHVLSYNQLEL
ncbi:histidine phosphatase family protein [Lacticaseibacillus saniviri]|uniref:Phosphoglycerate mutase family protein n=1 Tax=Lacticaseibacillus saniviri JCM 17471 = DSM 24301 TaxID=1293598 RepID=A0A0R2MU52_9LACO|nr:histidine phosphatase family protein [Lacticaseibacillus saniviri]KRO17151.1 Phosphoglycerate mutase family protein [Lacticaseibacillus saniviri JCM 17471 = DSM 24301]MCG4282615.1 histidine phosphatase family protein [Lacticaseibacillus saniviri]